MALSTLVAAVGLIRGDIAIVIGAMVIAPLLGPNVGLSLASTLGDPDLAKRSLKAIGAGIATAAALSLILGLLLNIDPSAREIAARTRTDLADVMLALAAGVAGTLAFYERCPGRGGGCDGGRRAAAAARCGRVARRLRARDAGGDRGWSRVRRAVRLAMFNPGPVLPDRDPAFATAARTASRLDDPGNENGGPMTRASIRFPATCLLLMACAAPGLAQNEVQRSERHAFRVVTVAEGLQHPWSMAFLPGGDMLVTERPGRLRIIRDGVLQPEPITGVPEVRARGQGGLLDVVLHPDFESNRVLYLSFSKPNADASEGTTAVVRARFDGDRLTDVEEIFEAAAWSRGGNHFGSRMAFDGAGYLFVTVGDRAATPDPATREQHPAQDLSNHQGTVNRLHDDGRVPEDNPFVDRPGARPEIWSYGHRNLQGLAFNSETGDLWQNEHGPQGGDELNLVLPGRNYGWPVIGYGVQYGGSVIHEGTHREGMEQPAHYWVPSIATSGLMVYTGDRFPGWNGNIFVGGLAGEQLARLTLEGRRVVSEETLLKGLGRVRDVRQGPDGFIYVAIEDRGGGRTPIVRLEPAEGS